jgi:hypothetical protein
MQHRSRLSFARAGHAAFVPALLCAAAFAGDAHAQYQITSAQRVSLPRPAAQVAVGDVTGDGRKDVIVLSDSDCVGRVYVYAQNADGTLPAQPKAYWVPNCSEGLAIGDLNRDGVQDLVVGSGAPAAITTRVSDPTTPLTLRSETRFLPSPLQRVVLLKVDRDDFLDVVGLYSGRAPVYLRGDGAGGIAAAPIRFTRATAGVDLRVTDADGDGRQEFSMSAFPDGSLRVFHNNSGYGFTGPLAIDPGFMTQGHAWGDFDHDGRLDLATVGGGGAATYLTLYEDGFGSGRSVATAAHLDGPGVSGAAIAAADFNGDGRDDLLLAHGRLGLYLQGPAGLEAEVLQAGTALVDTDFAVGDVDGDGCTDAVAGNSSEVVVYRGSGCVGTEAPPLPDLQVALAATTHVVTVELKTILAQTPINAPLVDLAVSTRNASLQLGALPAGCVVRAQSATAGRIECLVATLAPASTTTLAIPITVTPIAGVRAGLGASVRVASDTAEQSLLNNAATAGVAIAPASLASPQSLPSDDALPRVPSRARYRDTR